MVHLDMPGGVYRRLVEVVGPCLAVRLYCCRCVARVPFRVQLYFHFHCLVVVLVLGGLRINMRVCYRRVMGAVVVTCVVLIIGCVVLRDWCSLVFEGGLE